MTDQISDGTKACPLSLDQEFFGDPYPTYRAIRESGNRPTEIVIRTGMAYLPPNLKAWLVTSYEDIEFVLRDPRFGKSIDKARPLFAASASADTNANADANANANANASADVSADAGDDGAARASVLYDNMANNDPPKHTRLRKPLNATFTSRAVAGKRAEIRRAALATLDAVAGAAEFDLVRDFAFPFSISVICDTLGVPLDGRENFNSWVQTITSAAEPKELRNAAGQMAEYLRDLIRRKRAGSDDDVLSQLAGSLDEAEAVAQAYALLAAGYETTANLIVTGFLTLAADPAQRERLWSDPALVPSAVEEMLRHQSPFNLSLYRYASEAVEVGGVEIPAGAIVFLSFAAANRDEQRFAAPDEFDIAQPRREHLAFGGGIHNCIGKHLARLEAEVAFEVLIERCPELSIRTPRDQFRWKASPTFRGLKSLVVGPGPAALRTNSESIA